MFESRVYASPGRGGAALVALIGLAWANCVATDDRVPVVVPLSGGPPPSSSSQNAAVVGSDRDAAVEDREALADAGQQTPPASGGASSGGASSGSACMSGTSGGTGGNGPLMTGGSGGVGGTAPLFPLSVGTPCSTQADCAGAPLICVPSSSTGQLGDGGPQGGYCSLPCRSSEECAAVDDLSGCVTSIGYCLALCLTGTSESKCSAERAQACAPISTGSNAGVCIPRCTSNAACGAGRFCDPGDLGLCVDRAPAGGAVGAPCTMATAANDCASAICLEFNDPQNLNVRIGGFCSASCTVGIQDGCGFDSASLGKRPASCLQAQASDGQPGDLGYCFPLCDVSADCAQSGNGWACKLFADPYAEQITGRLGQCLPSALANPG